MKCPHCGFETRAHKKGIPAFLELATVHLTFERGGYIKADENDRLICPKTGKEVDVDRLLESEIRTWEDMYEEGMI